MAGIRHIDQLVTHIAREDYIEGHGSPINVITPDFIGQVYVDIDDKKVWMAYEISKNSGWAYISYGGERYQIETLTKEDITEMVLTAIANVYEPPLYNPEKNNEFVWPDDTIM